MVYRRSVLDDHDAYVAVVDPKAQTKIGRSRRRRRDNVRGSRVGGNWLERQVLQRIRSFPLHRGAKGPDTGPRHLRRKQGEGEAEQYRDKDGVGRPVYERRAAGACRGSLQFGQTSLPLRLVSMPLGCPRMPSRSVIIGLARYPGDAPPSSASTRRRRARDVGPSDTEVCSLGAKTARGARAGGGRSATGDRHGRNGRRHRASRLDLNQAQKRLPGGSSGRIALRFGHFSPSAGRQPCRFQVKRCVAGAGRGRKPSR